MPSHAQLQPATPAAPDSSTLAKTAAPPDPAGSIQLVDGNSRIIPAVGPPRPAKVGDIVNEGDTLVTGEDGEIHLAMQDSGFIALRPNTRFRIVTYRAEGAAGDKAI